MVKIIYWCLVFIQLIQDNTRGYGWTSSAMIVSQLIRGGSRSPGLNPLAPDINRLRRRGLLRLASLAIRNSSDGIVRTSASSLPQTTSDVDVVIALSPTRHLDSPTKVPDPILVIEAPPCVRCMRRKVRGIRQEDRTLSHDEEQLTVNEYDTEKVVLTTLTSRTPVITRATVVVSSSESTVAPGRNALNTACATAKDMKPSLSSASSASEELKRGCL